MASDYGAERLTLLLNRLIVSSKAGKIDWTATDRQGSFQYAAENASVIITCRDNDGQPPIEMTLLDESGNYVEKIETAEGQDENGEWWESDWNKPLTELWDIARRKVLNVDAVLDSLLAELDDDIPL